MNRLIPRIALGLLAALACIASSCPVAAQEITDAAFGGSIVPRRISMGVGKAAIIDLPVDAAEIFVANPKIANAVVRSPRKLYVIGMEAGQTNIFALDPQGRKIAALELSIGRDIGGLQQILRAAMPSAAITARTVNETIILTGTVDSAEEAQRATDIANGFAQRFFGAGSPGGPPGGVAGGPAGAAASNSNGPVVNALTIRGRAQVMLKVTVAEVSRSILKQLGITTSTVTVSWGLFDQFNPFPINGVLASAPVLSANPLATAAQNGTATAFTAHNHANSLSATLQAFERYGVTRVLAEPTVSAISGESARLVVGGEIPIPGPTSCIASGCTGGGAIFKEYGVALGFTPVVLAEGRIELRLATEVTEIDTQTSAVVLGTLVPGFFTRKNVTTVEIPSGGSIVSAGLLQTQSRQAINGLPGLLDLPILGALFRSRDYQRLETELLIVVTPYIVKPAGPNEIAKPTDGFADASDPQAWFLGRMNRLYASPGNPEAIKDYVGPVGFIRD